MTTSLFYINKMIIFEQFLSRTLVKCNKLSDFVQSKKKTLFPINCVRSFGVQKYAHTFASNKTGVRKQNKIIIRRKKTMFNSLLSIHQNDQFKCSTHFDAIQRILITSALEYRQNERERDRKNIKSKSLLIIQFN